MKYFDILTSGAADALRKRGVDTDKLLYCFKCDMDGDGMFYDSYVTFDSERLYVVSGYDRTVYDKKKRGKAKYGEAFDFESYAEYEMTEITELYVDRYRHTCRLMGKSVKGEDLDVCVGRFSGGFSEKAERFCVRYTKTVKKEEIDDSDLAANDPYCPKCGKRYPDPNRKYCPYCVKRSSLFKRLLGLFKDFKLQVILIIIMLLLSAILGIVSSYFGTAFLYDRVLDETGDFYGQVLFAILVMAGMRLLSVAFNSAYGIIFSFAVSKIMHKIRTMVFDAMERLSLHFFVSKQTSSLMTRVDRDANDVYDFFTDIVPRGISNIVKILVMLTVIFALSPTLALGILAIMAGMLIVEVIFIKGQRRMWRARNITERRLKNTLSDAVNGHRVIKAFAREKQENERFSRCAENCCETEKIASNRGVKFNDLSNGLFAVGNAVITVVGLYKVICGDLNLGAFMLMLNYFGELVDPMSFFAWAANAWSRCVDAASRIFEIIDSEPTVKPPEVPAEISGEGLKGDIKVKDVSFEYEAGVPVIKNLSLDIKSGQFFGIVGKTGAGKSTIINLISRLYDPSGGEITIDNIPVKRIAFDDLRRNIGVVSQETYIFSGTIADNIRYARPDASIEEVVEAAKNANAHDFIMQLPNGYDTMTGNGGVSLSGGEKQRISIARALIQKPNILILDEATASMDTRTERKIQNAIDNLKKGRTIIAIAHRLSTLRDADVLCVIENGEVKETGTHDTLIRQKGKYFELYRMQSEALKNIGVE